jgi:hypothetical protein
MGQLALPVFDNALGREDSVQAASAESGLSCGKLLQTG